MEEKLTSEGKCIYCGKLFQQKAVAAHLTKHLSELEKEIPSEKERGYHLSVKAGDLFLQVLVNGSATFKTLDTFLRKIWVDCCDHMSDFRHGDIKIRMSEKVFRVLSPKVKFDYIYDYGDTTSFTLSVVGVYQLDQKENVVLLSRNEPLKIMCRVCNERPATSVCIVHLYETDKSFFCNVCASKHEDDCEDFSDYANMPVVNSPRMAVCGYTGGSIDLERDGAYVIPGL